jgi:putative oxidoreductase
MDFIKFLSKYEQQVYAILRIITGFLFLWHGSQKYFNYPPLPPGVVLPHYVVYIGGTIELIGGILIMIGLFTRWAAFFSSGEMAFAYWTAHAPHAVLPMVNQGELAVIYCFLFLYIWARGAGIWSIDHMRKRNIRVE